jgi:hypothetical protein
MFTAVMSGCSLGLGSSTYAGVRAAHVNSASASLTGNPDAAQKQDQYQKLVALNLTAKVITHDEYLKGPTGVYDPSSFDPYVKTTPFGFRPQLKAGKIPMPGLPGNVGQNKGMSLPWRFCWQKYRTQGKNVTYLGLEQHAGGIF